MVKVIPRFLKAIRKVEVKLSVRDETAFSSSLSILPGIDINTYWSSIPQDERNNFWTLLQRLYVAAEMMASESKGSQSETTKDLVNDMITDINKHSNTEFLQFNPFTGISNENENSNLSIDELYDPNIKIPGLEQQEGSSIPGLGSLIDLDQLKGQLANMNQEDLDKATDTIKQLLGSDIDDKTSDTISDMLSSITTELKNTDLDKGDPIKNIFKIANSVANKMKGKIDTDGLNVQNLMNSTKTLAGKCMDEQGSQLFGESASLLNMLMGGMNPQAMQQCKEMMDNLDPNNMTAQDLSNIQQSLTTSSKSSKKRRKKGKKRRK